MYTVRKHKISQHGLRLLRFRGYAAPFLSQDKGVSIIRQTTVRWPSVSRGWKEFAAYYQWYPSRSAYFAIIYDLNAKASTIYLARVQGASEPEFTAALINDFQSEVEALPEEYLTSSHILVWPIFIAALESKDQGTRKSFMKMLEKQHERLQFDNIAKALEFLTLFWTGHTQRNWAQFLTELDVFIF